MIKRNKPKTLKKVYIPPVSEDPISVLGRKLTKKQQRFADEYLLDLSKHKAAERIGYTNKSAWQMGRELYDLPQVQSYISYMLTERRNKILSSQERIIQELERIAFFDPRCMLRADGTQKGLAEYNDDEVAVFDSIEFKTLKQDRRYKPVMNGNGNRRSRKDGRPVKGNGAVVDEKEITRIILKKISRYSKMDALKMLGAYHDMKLSAVDQGQGAITGKPSGVIESLNFETLLRNLDAQELTEFKRLLAKAANDGDAADSYADGEQGTGRKESR